MREEQGLELVTQNQRGRISAKILSKLLLEDLELCYCRIFSVKMQQMKLYY